MISWQSVLSGAVPVTITAAALLLQQYLIARSARELHGMQTQTARRDEMLAAHRHALTRLSAMHDALRADAIATVRALDAGTHEPPEVAPVPRDLDRQAEDAISEVALLCGEASAVAASKYRAALLMLGLALFRPDADVERVTDAEEKCNSAHVAYLLEAKKELKTDEVSRSH